MSLPLPPVNASPLFVPVRLTAVLLPALVTVQPFGPATAARFTEKPLAVRLAVPALLLAAVAVQAAASVALTVAPSDTFSLSTPPLPRSVIVSEPALTSKRSTSSPPVRVSLPVPPRSVSSLLEPVRRTLVAESLLNSCQPLVPVAAATLTE